MSISQDERERAVFRSRRMFQSDMDSNIATAEARGELVKAKTIARNMMEDGEAVDKIVKYTGLTHEEVKNLKV